MPGSRLGGSDLGIGVEPDHDGTPSGCGSILFETEKPFLVYNYVNIYGVEHYWRRDRNGNSTDEDSYFWQYGHCIAAKSGESQKDFVDGIRKAIKNLPDEFIEEIDDAWGWLSQRSCGRFVGCQS